VWELGPEGEPDSIRTKEEMNMTTRKSPPVLVLAVVTILGLTNTASAGIIIDNFTTADPPTGWYMKLGVVGGNVTVVQTKDESGLDPAVTVGGTRDWTFTSRPYTWGSFTTTGGNDAALTPADVMHGRRGLFLSNGATRSGNLTINLLYDGGGAGLDLDLSDTASIVLDHWTDTMGNLVPTVFALTLSDGTNSQTVTHTYPTLTMVGDWRTETFFMSDFTLVNLANIQTIQFDYTKGMAADVVLASIETVDVPEPTTMGLLGLGLGVLARLRKRRA
jgi:hypothetical protein